MTDDGLAALEASLTLLAGTEVLLGMRAIRRGRERAHRWWMGAAVLSSGAFFAPFLTRLAEFGWRAFRPEGGARTLFWALLGTHSLAALLSLPTVLLATGLGVAKRNIDHRQVSAVALPTWLFALASGLALYVLLFLLP